MNTQSNQQTITANYGKLSDPVGVTVPSMKASEILEQLRNEIGLETLKQVASETVKFECGV